jgi:uncharacterized protein (TIGR02646 family)
MIHFNKKTAPSCLTATHETGVANAIQWGLDWEIKLQKDSKATFNWRSYEGVAVNQILIARLRLLTNDHCCFCDKHAPEQDSDSIEHFKPKHIYPKVAYAWSNLFLCCTGCQKRAKGWKTYEHKQHLVLKPDVASYLPIKNALFERFEQRIFLSTQRANLYNFPFFFVSPKISSIVNSSTVPNDSKNFISILSLSPKTK